MFKIENNSLKELLIILGVSAVTFWLIKPRLPKNENGNKFLGNSKAPKKLKKPVLDPDAMANDYLHAAYVVLCAYIDAYNNGESQSELNDLRERLYQETGFDVIVDDKGLLAIKDGEGNDVLVND